MNVQVEYRIFVREAVTQPGEDLSWTACLSTSFSEVDELQFITDHMKKKTLEEEQLCYLPPRMEQGILQSAVIVSDGTLVGAEPDASPVTKLGLVPQCEERLAEPVHAEVVVEEEVCEEEAQQKSLVPEVLCSVLGEAGGDQAGCSADGREVHEQKLDIEIIVSDVPRVRLAEATRYPVIRVLLARRSAI